MILWRGLCSIGREVAGSVSELGWEQWQRSIGGARTRATGRTIVLG